MRKLILLFLSASAFAAVNCSRYDGIAQSNVNGFAKIAPSALITVCTAAATGQPCTPVATIYSDNACSVVVGSVSADANGNFHFYADSGQKYKYQVSGSGLNVFEIDDLSLPPNLTSSVTFSGGLTALKLENIRFSDTANFASSQAAVNDCGTNPCLVINPSQLGYTTVPTDTGTNKLYFDLDNSYFVNNSTDSAGATFFGYMGNANTLDSTKAPYDFLRLETHANAANLNSNAFHVVSFKIDATAESSLGSPIGVYDIYENLNVKNVGDVKNTQHAIAEEIVNDSAQADPSVLYGHDLHLIRHNAVSTADGSMVGYEVGIHKDGPAFAISSYAIQQCTRATNVVTCTYQGAPVAAAFQTNTPQQVTVTGVTGGTTAFNGQFQLTPGQSTTSQFQYSQTGANESSNATTGFARASAQQTENAIHVWVGNYQSVVTSPTASDSGVLVDDSFGSGISWNNAFILRRAAVTRFRVDGSGHVHVADASGPAFTSAGGIWPGLIDVTRDPTALSGQMICMHDFTSASQGSAGADGWCSGFLTGTISPYFVFGHSQATDSNFTRANSSFWCDPTTFICTFQGINWGDGATGNKGGVDKNGLGTFNGGLNSGVSGSASQVQTINTRLGAGAQHVNNYITNTNSSGNSEFDAAVYLEHICGTPPGSAGTGNVITSLIAGAATDSTCARQIQGIDSIVRNVDNTAGLVAPMRSFEADYVNATNQDAVLDSSANAGDKNQTGGLFASNGTKKGGIGVWIESNTRGAGGGDWRRGLVVQDFSDVGVDLFASDVGTSVPVIRVRDNGDTTTVASISGAGLLRASQAISDQGTACTNGELALSAGWQSTGSATVTNVKGTGQTCEWTITTGTTTAANPTVTDTLTNALPTANTVCWMIITGGNRTPAAGDSFDQTTLSATAPVFTFQGTPTAGGKTYQVVRACGP